VLRSDPEVDFLGLALADAVSSSLSGLSSLVVRSSAASSRFAVEAPDLPSIATQLDVDLVLGHLAASGDRLRVSTQLVEAPADLDLVAHHESEVGDLFRLQDDLTGDRRRRSRAPRKPDRFERPGETPPARAPTSSTCAPPRSPGTGPAKVARDLYPGCVAEDPGFARLARASGGRTA
jgi:TolB-like protein